MQLRMIQPLEVLVVQTTDISGFVYDAFSEKKIELFCPEIQRIKKEQRDSTLSA